MSVFNTYTKRNRVPSDVFTYDLTEKIKIQIVHIWTKFFKQVHEDVRREIWKKLHLSMCEEFGLKSLMQDGLARYYDSYRVEYFFENSENLDECLDVIEFVFNTINKVSENYHRSLYMRYPAEEAINDLNTRFLENNIGFEYQQNCIIRVDNNLLHKEVIIPTFSFITSTTFQNVNDEFLSAHLHYRNKQNKECLNDCLKSLETTMKIICSQNNWLYNQNDTAKTLIEICLKNKLIPEYLQTQLTSLRAVLESGIPTLRNKLGGHGQGVQKLIVPDHFASYMLFMTGSTIKFLISCQKEIKPFV